MSQLKIPKNLARKNSSQAATLLNEQDNKTFSKLTKPSVPVSSFPKFKREFSRVSNRKHSDNILETTATPRLVQCKTTRVGLHSPKKSTFTQHESLSPTLTPKNTKPLNFAPVQTLNCPPKGESGGKVEKTLLFPLQSPKSVRALVSSNGIPKFNSAKSLDDNSDLGCNLIGSPFTALKLDCETPVLKIGEDQIQIAKSEDNEIYGKLDDNSLSPTKNVKVFMNTIEENPNKDIKNSQKTEAKRKILIKKKPVMHFGGSGWKRDLVLSPRDNEDEVRTGQIIPPQKNINKVKQPVKQENVRQQRTSSIPQLLESSTQSNTVFTARSMIKDKIEPSLVLIDFSELDTIDTQISQRVATPGDLTRKPLMSQSQSQSQFKPRKEEELGFSSPVVTSTRLPTDPESETESPNLKGAETPLLFSSRSVPPKNFRLSVNPKKSVILEREPQVESSPFLKTKPVLKKSVFDEEAREVEVVSAGETRKKSFHLNLDIFNDNKDAKVLGLDQTSVLDIKDIIRSSRRANTQRPLENTDPASAIVEYGGGITIRPKFMEKYGSMCFTELWGQRKKGEYIIKRTRERCLTQRVAGESNKVDNAVKKEFQQQKISPQRSATSLSFKRDRNILDFRSIITQNAGTPVLRERKEVPLMEVKEL